MRILLVTTWYPSQAAPSSGAFVAKDAHALAEDHDVHVVHLASPALLSPADAAADAGSPVRVTRIPMRTSAPFHWLRARRALEAHLRKADVLHTQAFSALLPFAARGPRLPWVHTEHWSGISRPESVSPVWQVIGRVLRPLLRRPDVVTAVCEFLAAPIRRSRPGEVRVVPCIVEPAGRLASWPSEADGLRLTATGGLVDGKDPLLAVDVVRELVDRGHDAALSWQGDGPLREAVVQHARDAGVLERLTLPGAVSPESVAAAIDAARVFLLPTRGENFCVSAAEAIVRGRPAVIGAVGGQREYVTPANGRLVAERAAGAYADAIEEVLAAASDPELVASTIGDAFSRARVRAAYEDAYATAGAARGAGR